MNHLTYLALIALSAITFPAAGHSGLLMALAGFKCLLVGLIFMNLRHAHMVWKLGYSIFIGFFLTLFLALS